MTISKLTCLIEFSMYIVHMQLKYFYLLWEKSSFYCDSKERYHKVNEKHMHLNCNNLINCLVFIPDLSCDGMPPPDVLYCSMKCYEKGFTDGYCNSERRCICRNCRCSAWMFSLFQDANNIFNEYSIECVCVFHWKYHWLGGRSFECDIIRLYIVI